MHVEFTFLELLTLYSWPLRGKVETSTSSRLVPGRRWRTCEVSTRYLKNCANACWNNVFWVINPLWSPWGNVESSTPAWPVPESHWCTCEVSTLYLENCANAHRIYIFELLTLYFWPLRGRVESSTSSRPVPGRRWRTCEVSTRYLKNCANACWNNVFWVINPLFLSPMGYRRIVNPSTTCSGKSLTYLRSLNLVSWKLCECIETEGQTDRDRDRRLFIDIDISVYPFIYRSIHLMTNV